ncbi:DNA-directed RNA polymerase subunit P [Candidatus Micrarchaeota archaeon]|nr:DNA-directed RNA polymerase subunit P [Candidatus Micrarchaeota archaeon]
MYICGNPKCRKEIKVLDPKFIRCPYCGYRIVYKKRAPIAREISTD